MRNSFLKQFVGLLLLMQFCSIAFGAEPPPKNDGDGQNSSYWKEVLNSVKFQATTANLAQSQQPATVQFTSDIGSGTNSYAIDLATSANLVPTAWTWMRSHTFFGPAIEYHRNSLASKAQDNLQIGATAYEMLFLPTDNRFFTHGDYFFVQETVKYVRDEVTVGNSSLFPSLDLSGFVKNWGMSSEYPFFNTVSADGKSNSQLTLEWIPDFGFQYQSGNNIRQSKMSGDEVRLKASVEIDAYPFKAMIRQRVRLYSSVSYWHSEFRSGQYKLLRPDTTLFKSGVSYYFDEARHFSIGADYTNGENVEAGQLRQQTVTISLQVKY